MNVQRWDFLLLLALAAAATMPACAQTVTPAAKGDASIPDFSGIWSHPSFPGFEPPASGPGPVVNKSRRPQANFDGRVLLPGNNVLVSNPAQLVGDYTNPILKPQAAEVVKKKGEMESRRRRPSSVGPNPFPISSTASPCRCSSSGTRSFSFIPTITRFATFG